MTALRLSSAPRQAVILYYSGQFGCQPHVEVGTSWLEAHCCCKSALRSTVSL